MVSIQKISNNSITKNIKKVSVPNQIKLGLVSFVYGSVAKEAFKNLLQDEFQPVQNNTVSVNDVVNFFEENGFKKSKFGKYKKKLTRNDESEMSDRYGDDYLFVRNFYKRPLNKIDFACFKDFLELGKDKAMNLANSKFNALFESFFALKDTSNFKSIREKIINKKIGFDLISNAIENIPNKETLKSFNKYKKFHSEVINKELRKKAENPSYKYSFDVSYDVDRISNYLNSQTIEKPITVYRAEGIEVLSNVKMQNGKNLNLSEIMNKAVKSKKEEEIKKVRELVLDNEINATQSGFLSTSLDSSVIDNSVFSRKNGIFWELTTKPNTKGIYLEAINFSKVNSFENEVLFQKDSQITIKDIEYDKEKKVWLLKGDVSN